MKNVLLKWDRKENVVDSILRLRGLKHIFYATFMSATKNKVWR